MDDIVQISVTIGLLLVYLIVNGLAGKFVHRFSVTNRLTDRRQATVKKFFQAGLLLGLVILLTTLWGYNLNALYAASVGLFTLIGIAFFAVWSILSNITSGVIIFFRFPMEIGDTIDVMDMDGAEGKVTDITTFHLLLENQAGQQIAIPNNVVMQKGLKITRSAVSAKKTKRSNLPRT